MARVSVKFDSAKEQVIIGTLLHTWLEIQMDDRMTPEDIDRILCSWFKGECELVYDTMEIRA